MINIPLLQEALISYQEDFIDTIWPDERYKWQAMQHFQQCRDVNAADFPAMLHDA